MKIKNLILSVSIICTLLVGCTQHNNKTNSNGNIDSSANDINNNYETSASKYIEWYETTPEDFRNDFNNNLPDDIKKLEVLKASELSTTLSNNGETWKILIKTHDTDNTKEADGKISSIELSLYSDCKEDDIENGKFIRAFLNTLNPNQAEHIEDMLKIYNPDEISTNMIEYSYGNTRFVYTNGESCKLNAFPIATYSEEEHTPIKPE